MNLFQRLRPGISTQYGESHNPITINLFKAETINSSFPPQNASSYSYAATTMLYKKFMNAGYMILSVIDSNFEISLEGTQQSRYAFFAKSQETSDWIRVFQWCDAGSKLGAI